MTPTPEEIADDMLRRCWWRQEDHPGELRPKFAGWDKEVAAAIRTAEAVAFARAMEQVMVYLRSMADGKIVDLRPLTINEQLLLMVAVASIREMKDEPTS